MKNGYTPKQYAYALAIDALYNAEQNREGELADLTPSERAKAIEQIRLLRLRLADQINLEVHA
jgi:hypothetical protein